MLQGASQHCLAACRFLCNIWKVDNVAWVDDCERLWRKLVVLEGTAQGDTSASSAFSRGYRLASDKAHAKLASEGVHVHLPSLVDD